MPDTADTLNADSIAELGRIRSRRRRSAPPRPDAHTPGTCGRRRCRLTTTDPRHRPPDASCLRRGHSGSGMGARETSPGRRGQGRGLIIPPPSTRASRADQAHGVNVVRPVGRSTLTPWAWPAPLTGGSTATG